MKYFFLSGFLVYYANIILTGAHKIGIKSEYGEMLACLLIILSLAFLQYRRRNYLPALSASVVNLLVVIAGCFLRYKYNIIGGVISTKWDFLFVFLEVLCFAVFIKLFTEAATHNQHTEKNANRLQRAWGYSLGFAIAYTTLILSTIMIARISDIWDLNVLSSYFTKNTWSTFMPMLVSGFASVVTFALSQVKIFHAVLTADL